MQLVDQDDAKTHGERTGKLVDQYAKHKLLEGQTINAQLTLEEK